MTDTYQLRVGKYHFSSEAPLPSEQVLMEKIGNCLSGQSKGLGELPASIFEDESEAGQEFFEKYNDLRQEVSLLHPYINCIHDGPPPGFEDEAGGDDEEEIMCSFWLTSPEFDALIEPRAVELAKSMGLV